MASSTIVREHRESATPRGRAPPARSPYRQRPLERLSSPERLDQLLRVVRPQAWILLGALALGLALVVTWSVLSTIPVTASGTAILVRPKHVVGFQSPATGQIASLSVAVGDTVEKGALLARLDLPDLAKQLEHELTRLEEFESQSAELLALERELADKERGFLAEQRRLLELRILTVQATADDARARSDELIAQQRVNIQTARQLSEELGQALESRHQIFNELEAKGLIPRDLVVDARGKAIDKQLKLAELDVEEQALRMRENEARESYDGQMDLIRDLGMQLNALELREMDVFRKLRVNELGAAGERQNIQRRIGQLQARLANEERVLSEYAGRVLELTTFVGQRVDVGSRLGKLEIEDAASELMALAYFEVGQGKTLRTGQRILISPSVAQRERFGSLVGRVKRVSSFPVTVEAAANQVGDLELARALLDGRRRIEVLASLALDPSTPTGYAWTSGRGPPDVEVTGGTTAHARVTTEERAPITFVLPFLRSLSGS